MVPSIWAWVQMPVHSSSVPFALFSWLAATSKAFYAMLIVLQMARFPVLLPNMLIVLNKYWAQLTQQPCNQPPFGRHPVTLVLLTRCRAWLALRLFTFHQRHELSWKGRLLDPMDFSPALINDAYSLVISLPLLLRPHSNCFHLRFSYLDQTIHTFTLLMSYAFNHSTLRRWCGAGLPFHFSESLISTCLLKGGGPSA